MLVAVEHNFSASSLLRLVCCLLSGVVRGFVLRSFPSRSARSVLVYSINVLRKSSGHHRQIVQRYFLRHSPRGRSLAYRRSAFTCVGIDTSLPVSRTQSNSRCKERNRSARWRR